jgi:NAD(P)-dependent dehydrogenase (short-subunit alcohol dehydrogenase family)
MTGGRRTTERTVVLTGATSGIGRAVATRLAQASHRLILTGRDPDRARTLKEELPQSTTIVADISTRHGVNELADQVTRRTDRVDLLINAAGLMLPTRRVSADGVELNRAVHHHAPHQLVERLTPLLLAGSARVVNVSSEGHRAALFRPGPIDIDFDDLNFENGYDSFICYSRTKLANLLDGLELQRRRPELTVISVHPGMVRTELGREFPRARVAAMHAISTSARTAALAIVRLATSPDVHAGYYDRERPARPSSAALNRATAARLWDITGQLTDP